MWSPVSYWFVWSLFAASCLLFWYISVSNSARSRLKPVVLTLARLLEITRMRMSCASRPLRAVCKAEVIAGPSCLFELQERRAVHVNVAHAADQLALHIPAAGLRAHLHHRVQIGVGP